MYICSLGLFQTSRDCRAKVKFNSINLVRHGSSTTFETGLSLCTGRIFTCHLFLLDIDECEDPTVCPDKADCFNMAGSFMCHCLPGYKMIGQTCKSMYLFYHQVLFQGALELATPKNDSQIVTIKFVSTKKNVHRWVWGGEQGWVLALKELRDSRGTKGGGGECVTGMAFFIVLLVVFVERSLKTERVWDFS